MNNLQGEFIVLDSEDEISLGVNEFYGSHSLDLQQQSVQECTAIVNAVKSETIPIQQPKNEPIDDCGGLEEEALFLANLFKLYPELVANQEEDQEKIAEDPVNANIISVVAKLRITP